jgi:hypothetical protein
VSAEEDTKKLSTEGDIVWQEAAFKNFQQTNNNNSSNLIFGKEQP